VNPGRQRAIAAGAAVLAGSTLLRRSLLLRLGVVGGLAAVAYRKAGGHEPEWHDVTPPEPPA